MDVIVSFKQFRKIVEKGKYSGVVIEGRGYALASVGNMVLIARKPTPKRIYTARNIQKLKLEYPSDISYPALQFGRFGIHTTDINDRPIGEDDPYLEIQLLLTELDTSDLKKILDFISREINVSAHREGTP